MLRPARIAAASIALFAVFAACGGNGPATDQTTGDDGGSGSYSSTGVPYFEHVYLIVEENHGIDDVKSAPFISSLMSKGAYLTNYMDSLAHPSLPNYLALTSGTTQGLSCDCQAGSAGFTCDVTCAAATGACNCAIPSSSPNLANQIETKGLTWHAFGEDMPSACDTDNTTTYVARHVPFIYYEYDGSITSADCSANAVAYVSSTFSSELGQYNYNFIAPNLYDDGHTQNGSIDEVTATDTWLSNNEPAIESGLGPRDVLFITWDEGSTSGVTTGDNVLLVALGPLVKGGTVVTTTGFDHFALLATIEDGLQLPRLATVTSKPAIVGLWK